MRLRGLTDRMAESLRLRVLALVLLGFAAVSVPAYFAFTAIVNSTVVQLGTLFAEKQILYDRYRGLETLMREVSLAETLAGTQAIRDWAFDEDDPQKRRRGLAELEHYRRAFSDSSYFFVIDASGNYYFNDAANSYAGDQYRYTIDPENPRDGWYYRTRALGEGCHLNVDNDDNLRVTKVWMNCVIREGNNILGILGTGIDLTAFIREVVDVPQRGVNAIFVDRSGAIQAHRNPELVDYHSLTKDMADKKTIFSLFEQPVDRERLGMLMEEVTSGEVLVKSDFMHIRGKEVLVGVGYLDRLGWYNVTIMDIDEIIDRSLFLPIAILLAVLMLGIAALLVIIFKRSVLDRLRRLETAVRGVERGDFRAASAVTDANPDEIGRLTRAFAGMAGSVGETTRQLESRVRERTAELERLAFMDSLTGIANRRGFIDAFETMAHGRRRGLLLIDIDHFKQINDTHGHAAGDAVVIETARRISQTLGANDHAARWGGDEFILALADSAPQLLRAAAYKMMAALTGAPFALPDGKTIAVTASIGACLVEPGDSIDTAADMADAALYMAKSEGRNQVAVLDRESADRLARG